MVLLWGTSVPQRKNERKFDEKRRIKMANQIVEKYSARLSKEGFLNASICALGMGFAALLVTSLVFWLTGFDYPWVSFIVMAAVTAGTLPLMYYKKFRPSEKEIAQRVDELGLKERLLTMVELDGDDSYIAVRQREDSKRAIENVSTKLLRVVASIPLIAMASVLALTGGAMATVTILSDKGILSSGKDLIEEAITPDPVYYEVEFVEEGGGMLDGDIFQMVEEGMGVAEVYAIPDDEWFLHQWVWEVDGVEYTLEGTDVFVVEDLVVNQNIIVTAYFVEVSESQQQGSGEGEPSDEPPESEPQEGEPTESEEGEDEENEEESEDAPPSDKPGGDQAGGESQANDMVIDGETDYGGDVYNNAVEDATKEVESNDDIPEDLKDLIGDYFDNIKK